MAVQLSKTGREDLYSVDFIDQIGARPATFQTSISFATTDIISVRELIKARVKSEIGKLRKRDELDPVRFAIYGELPVTLTINDADMIDRAVRSFVKRQYLLFVDSKQCAYLEDVVHLGTESKVKFLRITPLVGG
jgi:hypothetical protein